jgi:hypothetical protein
MRALKTTSAIMYSEPVIPSSFGAAFICEPEGIVAALSSSSYISSIAKETTW